jgi:predicted RNA-binding Zn ribbon-like protein
MAVTDPPFTARAFVGGHPVLDFVNTVAGRDQSPRDRLGDYPRLLDWATQAKLLPVPILGRLAREARRAPVAAKIALTRAKGLRESLFEVLTSAISSKTPARGALAQLREQWVAGVNAHELRVVDGRFVIQLRSNAADLNLIASVIAYQMASEVIYLPMERMRMCAGPNCAWVFIDRSKAGRRRWCDMAVCGNTAKARRFHARSH